MRKTHCVIQDFVGLLWLYLKYQITSRYETTKELFWFYAASFEEAFKHFSSPSTSACPRRMARMWHADVKYFLDGPTFSSAPDSYQHTKDQ